MYGDIFIGINYWIFLFLLFLFVGLNSPSPATTAAVTSREMLRWGPVGKIALPYWIDGGFTAGVTNMLPKANPFLSNLVKSLLSNYWDLTDVISVITYIIIINSHVLQKTLTKCLPFIWPWANKATLVFKKARDPWGQGLEPPTQEAAYVGQRDIFTSTFHI